MQWRTSRKLTYTLIALLPLLIVAGVIYIATFFPQPTCFDGDQNGGETGIDCGGGCLAVCQAETDEISILWDRAFHVGGDIYNLAAYIENPNTNLVAEDTPYTFRLYDKDNILITEQLGSVTLFPQSRNIVFIGGVDTNGRQPGRAVFVFTDRPFWEQSDIPDVDFPITNRRLTVDAEPRLTFDITNNNNQPFFDVEFTGVVFTSDGEVAHVSRTVIPRLGVEETASAVFTWRQPFSAEEEIYRTEIIPTAYYLTRQ
jgi:hypothetical protein